MSDAALMRVLKSCDVLREFNITNRWKIPFSPDEWDDFRSETLALETLRAAGCVKLGRAVRSSRACLD